MTIQRILIVLAAVFGLAFQGTAVTKEEMEQARVIAAQCYLRYANNGSGYLDEVKASSMADLEKKLKKKEQENLKGFKAVKIPSDYASWDKTKLVEYWSGTFLNSPGLVAEGKAAKSRIKARISAMTISEVKENNKKEEPKEEIEQAAPKTENVSEVSSPVAMPDTVAEALAAAEKVVEENIESIEKVEKPKKNDSSTWIYVAILIVLVALVIWLVVFASRTMGRNRGSQVEDRQPVNSDNSDEIAEIESKFNNTILVKNNELRTLSSKIEELESLNNDAKMKNRLLKQENEQLKNRIIDLEQQLLNTENSSSVNVNTGEGKARKAGRVIFVGRVNSKGIFVRADREFNPANDIYRLVTHDGLTGSFEIVDDEDLNDMIALSAKTMLSNGCQGIDFASVRSGDRIVTVTPGVAVFENGYWRVERKSHVDFD